MYTWVYWLSASQCSHVLSVCCWKTERCVNTYGVLHRVPVRLCAAAAWQCIFNFNIWIFMSLFTKGSEIWLFSSLSDTYCYLNWFDIIQIFARNMHTNSWAVFLYSWSKPLSAHFFRYLPSKQALRLFWWMSKPPQDVYVLWSSQVGDIKVFFLIRTL